MIEITMPRLSDTMEEGAIAAWRKRPGDHVEPGDVLVEIETDKATMEYEAYDAGTLAAVLVREGDTVAIGTPIALLDDGRAERIETGATRTAHEEAPPAPSTPAAAPVTVPAGAAPAPTGAELDARTASPLVRRLAREHHLDLRAVTGTGPGGRIIRSDIEELLAASAATTSVATAVTPASVPRPSVQVASVEEKRGSRAVSMNNPRRVIARRLGESARTIPHFFVTAVADVEDLVRLRTEMNAHLIATGQPKISLNDLVIRAVALALRAHPDVNASYVGDDSPTMLIHDRINIGMAVASDNGLVVPVIMDADQMSLVQISARARELAALADAKRLTIDHMSGGTFTISNLGMYGVEQFTAIINPPEGAILAVGATMREPVAVGDEVALHHRMRFTMSSDHRIIDGALAAQFLQTLSGILEHPYSLVL